MLRHDGYISLCLNIRLVGVTIHYCTADRINRILTCECVLVMADSNKGFTGESSFDNRNSHDPVNPVSTVEASTHQSECTAAPPNGGQGDLPLLKKKPTSFQITSVTVQGSRLSTDGGDDSADDLDESHTEDLSSDVLDLSRTTDVDNDPLSEENNNNASADVAKSISVKHALGNQPSKDETPTVESQSPSQSSNNDIMQCISTTVLPISVPTVSNTKSTEPTNETETKAPTIPPDQWQHRFKVVKIVSSQPYKRGRWLCMDFMDPPSMQSSEVKSEAAAEAMTNITGSGGHAETAMCGTQTTNNVAHVYEIPPNESYPGSISVTVCPQPIQQPFYGIFLPLNNSQMPDMAAMPSGFAQDSTRNIESSVPSMQPITVGFINQPSQFPQITSMQSKQNFTAASNKSYEEGSTQSQSYVPQQQTQPATQSPNYVPQQQQQVQAPQPATQSQNYVPQQTQPPQPATQSQNYVPQQTQPPQPATQSQNYTPQQTQPPQPTTQSQNYVPQQTQPPQPATQSQNYTPQQTQPPQSATQSQNYVPQQTQSPQPATQSQNYTPQQTQPPQPASQSQNYASQQTQPPQPATQSQNYASQQTQPPQPATVSQNYASQQTQPPQPATQSQNYVPQQQQQQVQPSQPATQSQSYVPQQQPQTQPPQPAIQPQSYVPQQQQAQPATQSQSYVPPSQQQQPPQPATQTVAPPSQQQQLHVTQSQTFTAHPQPPQTTQTQSFIQQPSPQMLSSAPSIQTQSISHVGGQSVTDTSTMQVTQTQGINSMDPSISVPQQTSSTEQMVSLQQPTTTVPPATVFSSQSLTHASGAVPETVPMTVMSSVVQTMPTTTVTSGSNIPPTNVPPNIPDNLISSSMQQTISTEVHNVPSQVHYNHVDARENVQSSATQPAIIELLPEISASKAATAAEETESAPSGSNTVAIDNKIEQAMDLVKSHLMFAVREEVDVLKEKITELVERISLLEYENTFLKANASQETLSQLNQSQQLHQQQQQQQQTQNAVAAVQSQTQQNLQNQQPTL